MAQPQPEKRSTRRFSLELPITVSCPGASDAELRAQSRDVSSRGVFMYVDAGRGAAVFYRSVYP